MKLLFIGNSHTYYHAMPYQCRALLAARDEQACVSQVVAPGKSLQWHGTNPETMQTLLYDHWDHVILQEASHPFAGTNPLVTGVQALLQLMPQKPSVWLYKTWCEQDLPHNQAAIDTAFATVSKDLGLPVIPVADVWHTIAKKDSTTNFYDADRQHANQNGSYLTALCIVRALTGQSTQGLPATLTCHDQTINSVSAANASHFQAVVDEVIPA